MNHGKAEGYRKAEEQEAFEQQADLEDGQLGNEVIQRRTKLVAHGVDGLVDGVSAFVATKSEARTKHAAEDGGHNGQQAK